MASRRGLQSLLSQRIYKGRRNFGAVPEASSGASSSQKLINFEYEYSAHK